VSSIGCGDGHAALALAASGHKVTAIDPVAPDGPIFERVTLEQFVPSEPFDAVVASLSLHHVPDLVVAMAKIAQLAPLLIVEEFAWDRFDEQTAAWYVAQLDGPSKSVEQCLREWDEEHAGLHGYETLRTELDRRFSERIIAWGPYLYRYPEVRADRERTGTDRCRRHHCPRFPLHRHTNRPRLRADPLAQSRSQSCGGHCAQATSSTVLPPGSLSAPSEHQPNTATGSRAPGCPS